MRGFLKRKTKWLGALLFLLTILTVVSVFIDIGPKNIIQFSRESGFYEDSFYLEIEKRKECTFYYTLDGSRPDRLSQKYTEPILVEDASKADNVYSARKDVSPGLDEKVRQKYGLTTTYMVPEYSVDKCTVIRVAAYDAKDDLIAEETGVYFIGFHEKSGYDGIGKIALITEPENLFDDEAGIYVIGKKDGGPAAMEAASLENDANYMARGREWEKEAFIDVFDPNGEELLSSRCGIRIHGGVTRAIPQKSFSVYAREEYGGKRKFEYDLFGNGTGPHKFILSSGGNDDMVKVRDYIVQGMAAEAQLDIATMKMFPCALFLNGEYWGVYYVTESYNASYLSDHYGVAEDNVVMVKQTSRAVEVEDGNEEDIQLYHEMVQYISSHDMRDEDAYHKACEMIDINNFIDYYAIQIYIGNHDWPENNKALWRTREKNDLNIWADGRWRYMLFDTNHLSVCGDETADDLERAITRDAVFASLIRNEEVERKFQERIRQLGSEVFASENCEEVLGRWYDEMNEPVKRSDERFYDMSQIKDVSYYISRIKTFFEERPAYMEKYMSGCFEGEN